MNLFLTALQLLMKKKLSLRFLKKDGKKIKDIVLCLTKDNSTSKLEKKKGINNSLWMMYLFSKIDL